MVAPADDSELNTAATLLSDGRANEALEAASRALLTRDDADARALFVTCVHSADRLPAVPGFRRLIVRALREAWARPVGLTGPAIALITNEPTVANAIRAAVAAWPQRLSQSELAPAMSVLVTDEVLRAVLDTALANDPALERLLTSVRAALLDVARHTKGKITRELAALACSLARQCFNNEYVFDVSDAERQGVAWLRASVRAALAERGQVSDIQLIALACYAPLNALERDREIIGRSWTKFLDALITEQVREPRAEAALRQAMQRLTGIADLVSQQVRQQYEDNPYPRWISVSPTAPAESLPAHVRGLFPDAPLRDTPQAAAPDILVAGCGTGQQPIGTAQRFANARVLAIDLSLASLAYAKRKTDALGITIDYAQADILELALDRRFDLIESSGVLHHLAEPLRGWRTLVELLKPGGFMRLGFYSELGRTQIVALQQRLAGRGYDGSADSIRRGRQELMSALMSERISAQKPGDAPVLHSPEFYSLSACRDLLFHVQEHRLALPQISAFLSQNGLTFLGFELDAATLAHYRRTFPDDTSMTDLDSWHRFETANPATFVAMYQFWIQKTP